MNARLCAMLWLASVGACALESDDSAPMQAAADGDERQDSELGVRVAQDGRAARAPFSLTASDGTGLALRALQAKVVLEPPLAFTQLELAFDNPEDRRLEGRFEIALPKEASISRLALQIGEHYQEGEVVERQRAHVAYEEALHERRDPALLERDAGNQYRLRIFPIEARETKRLIVSYSQTLGGNEEHYRLHLSGLPSIDRVELEVREGQGGEHPSQRFVRERWQPSGDLLVPLVREADDQTVGTISHPQFQPYRHRMPRCLHR
ncbi:MAG: VIT domain-containing protein [Myxococcales bacterium]|nr:VIT domain-containing protein [Myxococcales bacterium]